MQSGVLDLEAIPQLVEGNLAVGSQVFVLGASDGLTEAKEWQCKIDEAILVLLNVGLAVQDLVQLKVDQTSHERRCRRDGRDDLASNELGLVAVSLLDLVVLRAEVAGRRDEVDVVVGIIILLKLDRRELESCQRLGVRDLGCDLLKFRIVPKVP